MSDRAPVLTIDGPGGAGAPRLALGGPGLPERLRQLGGRPQSFGRGRPGREARLLLHGRRRRPEALPAAPGPGPPGRRRPAQPQHRPAHRAVF